jgi:hypothetical protein
MKKFTEINFKKDLNKDNISNDIENLDNQIEDSMHDNCKLDGEWEISSIIDISTEQPVNEAIIINADLGNKNVKRGDEIYITALIHRKGDTAYHQQQMGVLKVRVVDIYNSLFILNSLRK